MWNRFSPNLFYVHYHNEAWDFFSFFNKNMEALGWTFNCDYIPSGCSFYFTLRTDNSVPQQKRLCRQIKYSVDSEGDFGRYYFLTGRLAVSTGLRFDRDCFSYLDFGGSLPKCTILLATLFAVGLNWSDRMRLYCAHDNYSLHTPSVGNLLSAFLAI